MLQVDLFSTAAVIAVVVLLYHYVMKKYEYFSPKPLPCIKPTFLLGNNGPVLFRKTDQASHFRTLYNTFPDAKVTGFYDFTTPLFILRDPDMIKKLAVKDFDYFTDHSQADFGKDNEEGSDDGDTLFGNSLFTLKGQKWRDMRATLSPAFTGSKMRHMFELVADCGKSMVEFLKAEAKDGKKLEYEMKDTFGRFGSDVIATVAFGIKVDSFREPDNDFYVKGKKMMNFQSLITLLKFLCFRFMPRLMRWLKADFVDADSAEYFKRVIVDNMKQRDVHGIVRNDMIQMLMDVRKGSLKHQQDEKDTKDAGFATVEESQVGKSTNSRVWTENELIAQCFLFFLAGFDTVSACLTFLTYELMINPDIQERLLEEVMATEKSLNGKSLTYETLQQMEYMDMVVSETLRKWPPAIVTDRLCNKDYLYDDDCGARFVIEKGRVILIPTYGIHRDPKYFPNPEKFDPERFNETNRSQINTGAYLPFGVGPRNCIGSRLALMEVKCIVYNLLKDFTLVPTEKTQIPMQLARESFTLQPEKGCWIEFKPRDH